jgi:hypothetical protein
MRVFSVVVAMFVVVGVAQAQAPSGEPTGTLAQLMRGVFFPNSNLIFDVQSRDPEAPPEVAEDGSVTSTFSSIYTGWQVVENASIAIAEAANLLVYADRMCENGTPVPRDQDDFIQYAMELEAAGREAYEVAQTRDRDAVIEVTNNIAGACDNCHSVYRTYPEENRCQTP